MKKSESGKKHTSNKKEVAEGITLQADSGPWSKGYKSKVRLHSQDGKSSGSHLKELWGDGETGRNPTVHTIMPPKKTAWEEVQRVFIFYSVSCWLFDLYKLVLLFV